MPFDQTATREGISSALRSEMPKTGSLERGRKMIEMHVIDLLLKRAQVNFFKLGNFYDEGEMHFNDGLNSVEDRNKLEEEYFNHRNYLEELRELKRDLFIVGLFAEFELFLRGTLLVLLHFSGSEKWGSIWEKHLGGMKEEFRRNGVPITKPDCDWQAIMRLKEVRNCIIHSGGRPNEKTVKLLASSNLTAEKGVRIKLPDGYFLENSDLVERVCKRIAKDCQAAMKEEYTQAT